MAGPVEQPSAISVLEDAAHLLRRAPLDTLLCHWVGSVPFALGLLLFWNDLTHPRVSDLACAVESLAVALLLIWMNSWRSVFAGKLHRQLSGAAEKPWDRRRVWRLIANESFLAAAKLVVLPLSLLAVFPFAGTVAFFRNSVVLADREDLDPRAVIAKARRLSRIDRFQCWLLQFLLLLLSLASMLNVAITFIALPGLIKMVTGYESSFSRSGSSYYENRLFLLFVMGATWLVFDPFVQAVYCLRCFQGESVETGEDLRAGLRRVRSAMAKGAVAAVLFLALVVGPLVMPAAEAVGPGELEQAVRSAMQSPEYSWRIRPPSAPRSDASWIIQATDRAIAALVSAVTWLWDTFLKVLKWIFGGLGINPMPLGGTAPTAALHWSIWLLLGVAVALAGLVVWRALVLRRNRAKKPAAAPRTPIRLDEEGLTADRLPEEGWLEMAEQCMAEGNLRLALRAFYLANLAWLGRQEFISIHPGRTNREFEVELRRKARSFPEARELFSANVRSFERSWYGVHQVHEEDALEFRRRSDQIKALLSAGLRGKSEGAAA